MEDEKQNGFQVAAEAVKQTRDKVNRSWFGKSIDWVSHNFGAFIRQGSKEVAQILPAFPESVRPVEELGTMGNPTQQEVNREKANLYGHDTAHGKELQHDPGYEEWLSSRAAVARKPPENGMGMER